MNNGKTRQASKLKLGLVYSLSFFYIFVNNFMALAQADNALFVGPQKIIQQTSDKLQINLSKDPLKSDYSKAYQFVDEVLTPHIDIDRISRLTLGKHWKNANDLQKKRFQKELKILLLATFTTTFLEYADWSIRYLPLRMKQGKTKIIVNTKILQPGATPFDVSYRMKKNNGQWQVYDVITNGISLLINYRTSFKNEIAGSGTIDSVIRRLAKQNKKRRT